MTIFWQAVFWFGMALAYAIAEIEIEGKFGWSEKTQTWYRTAAHHRKSWFLRYIMGGKPLTGYHLPVFLIAILISHAQFFMGVKWSLAGELLALAVFTIWAPLWDNLWLFFNPNYGVGNLGSKKVWWYSHSYWVLGLVPFENLFQWIVSVGLAYLAAAISSNPQLFFDHLSFMGYMAVFAVLASVLLVPVYQNYYRRMRQHDDRKRAGISHR